MSAPCSKGFFSSAAVDRMLLALICDTSSGAAAAGTAFVELLHWRICCCRKLTNLCWFSITWRQRCCKDGWRKKLVNVGLVLDGYVRKVKVQKRRNTLVHVPQSLFLRSFSVKFKCNPVPGRSGTELAISIYRVQRI